MSKTKLSDKQYFQRQMQFLHDFMIDGVPKQGDSARRVRLEGLAEVQKIIVHPDFFGVDKARPLATLGVGYAPTNDTDIDSTFMAPDAAKDKAVAELRTYSCYRIVHGPIPFYLNQQFQTPTDIPLMSTCAPNLMRSSEIDMDTYSEHVTGKQGGRETRTLKKESYQKQCEKLADFIVQTAQNQGHTRLVMPPFGVGVYINTLTRDSKREATEIMFKAFAKAAEKYQLQVDWTIWSGATNSDPESIQKMLKSYADENEYINPVITADIIGYTADLREEQTDAVMLNPGSDRTIGGHYEKEGATPLEEQIAQQSDLIPLHSAFNMNMTARFYEEYGSHFTKADDFSSEDELNDEKTQAAPQPDPDPFASLLHPEDGLKDEKTKPASRSDRRSKLVLSRVGRKNEKSEPAPVSSSKVLPGIEPDDEKTQDESYPAPKAELIFPEDALKNLREAIKDLSVEKRTFIENALISLHTKLTNINPKDTNGIVQALNEFTDQCEVEINDTKSPALKGVATFGAVLAVAVIAGLIGFGIAVAVISLPGFIAAVTTGGAAAIGVITVGVGVGLVGGGLIGKFGIFREPGKQEALDGLQQFEDVMNPELAV